MEVSLVRNRLRHAIEAARERTRRKRERNAAAEREYDEFLRSVATPVTKLVATALKAEGYLFAVFTPAGGLRLADERGRDDYIELSLDTARERPEVVGVVRYTRGSRVITDERPLKPDTAPAALTEEDVLAFLLDALQPWLDR